MRSAWLTLLLALLSGCGDIDSSGSSHHHDTYGGLWYYGPGVYDDWDYVPPIYNTPGNKPDKPGKPDRPGLKPEHPIAKPDRPVKPSTRPAARPTARSTARSRPSIPSRARPMRARGGGGRRR